MSDVISFESSDCLAPFVASLMLGFLAPLSPIKSDVFLYFWVVIQRDLTTIKQKGHIHQQTLAHKTQKRASKSLHERNRWCSDKANCVFVWSPGQCWPERCTISRRSLLKVGVLFWLFNINTVFLGIWISMWRWDRFDHLILLVGIRILFF